MAVSTALPSSSATAATKRYGLCSMALAMASFTRSTWPTDVIVTPSPMHRACEPHAPSDGGSTTLNRPLVYGVLLFARFGFGAPVAGGAGAPAGAGVPVEEAP